MCVCVGGGGGGGGRGVFKRGGGGERGIGFSNRKGGESKPTEQKECTSSASFCDITSLEYCKNLQQRTCFFFNC